jgi:hypothetical protein
LYKNFFNFFFSISQRFSVFILLAAILLASASLIYSSNNLAINTSTTDMLSKDLEFRKNYENLKSNFPSLSNNILIVITAKTPDLSEDVAKQLSTSLRKEKDLFSFVFDAKNDPFFLQNGLLYLDTDELEDLSDNLARFQPFLVSLSSDASLNNFFKILNRAVENKSIPEKDLTRVFSAMAKALDQKTPMSWQSLMNENFADSQNNVVFNHFILAKPKTDFSTLQPAAAAIQKIREISGDMRSEDEMKLLHSANYYISITGGIVLEQEEMESALTGAMGAGVFALFLVIILIVLVYRSSALGWGSLFFLITSLSLTFAYATFFVGQLNLISIAFVILFIGIGIDLAIQFCLKYKEEIIAGRRSATASRNTLQNIGVAMAISSVAACIGFLSFVPTSYVGLAELGIISGGGMVIAFFASILLLPAFLKIFPPNPAYFLKLSGPYDRSYYTEYKNIITRAFEFSAHLLIRVGYSRSRLVIIFTIFLSLILTFSVLPKLEFDFDPMNLKDPSTESYREAAKLMKTQDGYYNIKLAVDDLDQAKQVSSDLKKLPVVGRVLSNNDFLPSDQESKMQIIDEMKLFLLPALGSQGTDSLESEFPSTKQEIRHFIGYLDSAGSRGNQLLADSLHDFRDNYSLKALEFLLLDSFHGRLERIKASLDAKPFAIEDLPQVVKDRNQGKDGSYLVTVYPSKDLSIRDNLKEFVREVRKVAPSATDSAVLLFEAGKEVTKAFVMAGSIAFMAIVILLLFIFRNVIDTALVLIPLVVAMIYSGAIAVFLGMNLNFANIIALPLLFSLGIAYGVYFISRQKKLKNISKMESTSTPSAILFSALTTMAAFGSLVLSPHRGTSSMGLLLLIALSMALLCTFTILPALLQYRSEKKF